MKSICLFVGLAFIANFSFAEIAKANVDDQKPKVFIDLTKGVSDLAQKTTRIFSLVTEIDYETIIDGTQQIVNLKSELSSPLASEDCEAYDVDNKYSVYMYNEVIEELSSEAPAFSHWYEGRKIPGKVIKRKIAYCFAAK